jgi:murein L,D-transpeptidase YafK
MKRLLIATVCLALALVGYTKLMGRLAGGPPPTAEAVEQADLITVDKAQRRMVLWRAGTRLAEYRVALGAAGDEGHKQHEGDERTPQGRYLIDWRNPKSMAYLSLHISYPNAADQAAAAARGENPGGNIMIHGLPNGWGWLGPLHHLWDWTDGCVAVTNEQMHEIWLRVANGTPIEIR